MKNLRCLVVSVMTLSLLFLTHHVGAANSGFSSSGTSSEKKQTATPPPRQSSPTAEKTRPAESRNETRREATGFTSSGSRAQANDSGHKKVERADSGATNRALEHEVDKRASSAAWERRNAPPSAPAATTAAAQARSQATSSDKQPSTATNVTSKPAAPAAHTSENEDRRFSQYRRSDDYRPPRYEERVVIVERTTPVYIPSTPIRATTSTQSPAAVESMAGASAVGAASPLAANEKQSASSRDANGGSRVFATIVVILIVSIVVCVLVYLYISRKHRGDALRDRSKSRYSL